MEDYFKVLICTLPLYKSGACTPQLSTSNPSTLAMAKQVKVLLKRMTSIPLLFALVVDYKRSIAMNNIKHFRIFKYPKQGKTMGSIYIIKHVGTPCEAWKPFIGNVNTKTYM